VSKHDQPVTATVIRWAAEESGYGYDELDAAIGVEPGTVRLWAKGDDQPNWTQLQNLARVLKRPVATFYLPEPPESDLPQLQFRAPPKADRKKLNPKELRYVREARRIQRVLSWLNSEDAAPQPLPKYSASQSPESVARHVRTLLDVPVDRQSSWASPSVAFDKWREVLERIGVYVFMFSLGADSSKGFSIWDDSAPVVAANTHWNDASRVFTVFHEVGHLLTRTSSVCLDPARQMRITHGDAQERWCERFAAHVLIPLPALHSFLSNRINWSPGKKIKTINEAILIARHFNVSLRSSVLRLIESGISEWSLYGAIPPVADDKSGGGGRGRARLVMREDAFGSRTTNTFLKGIQRDLITPYDAMSYLKVSDRDLAIWEEKASGPGPVTDQGTTA
jgi:Zn-dependent peptidase ImmA (M78 family)/DNA-binding XRE family transcriptional regulator